MPAWPLCWQWQGAPREISHQFGMRSSVETQAISQSFPVLVAMMQEGRTLEEMDGFRVQQKPVLLRVGFVCSQVRPASRLEEYREYLWHARLQLVPYKHVTSVQPVH